MLQHPRDPEQRCLSPFFPGRPSGSTTPTTMTVLSNLMKSQSLPAVSPAAESSTPIPTSEPQAEAAAAHPASISTTANPTTITAPMTASTAAIMETARSNARAESQTRTQMQPQPQTQMPTHTHAQQIQSLRKMASVRQLSESEKINLLFRTVTFKNADERLDMIDMSHKDAYEWMFEQTSERRDSNVSRGSRSSQSSIGEQTGFTTWLSDKNTQSVFWIGGVEGSGKSTMMKFLHQHDKTYSHLKRWADADRCRLFNVGHFFWGKGSSDVQKNYEGLLRSILFQVLSSSLELRFVLLRPYIDQVTGINSFRSSFWTIERLQEAFRTLLAQTAIPLKLCIFLDGLDETIELPDRLTGFIENARSTNVKICAASRPWPAFQDYFRAAKVPGIQLHRFRSSEVLTYVMRKLSEIIRFRSLERGDPVQAEELRTAFVERSCENLIWAKMAYKLMGKGLRDGASLGYLRKQVREFPFDLEQMYSIALDRVDEMYRRDAAVLFGLYREAQRHKLVKHSPNKGIQTFWALRHLMGDEPLESMKNHFRVEELDGISSAYSPALRDLRKQTLQTFSRLVESRTGGLLCVADLNARGIVVLHKSVDDFLDAQSTRRRLQSWLDKTSNKSQEVLNSIVLDTLRHGPATTWLSFLNNTLRISFIQMLIPSEPAQDWHRFVDKAVAAAHEGWERPRLREIVKKETLLNTEELLPAYMVAATGRSIVPSAGNSTNISSIATPDNNNVIPLEVLACLQQLPPVKPTSMAFLGAAYPCRVRDFITSRQKMLGAGYRRPTREELTTTLGFAVLTAAMSGRANTDVLYANIQWLLEHGADPSDTKVLGNSGAWHAAFNKVFRQVSKHVSSSASMSTSFAAGSTTAAASAINGIKAPSAATISPAADKMGTLGIGRPNGLGINAGGGAIDIRIPPALGGTFQTRSSRPSTPASTSKALKVA